MAWADCKACGALVHWSSSRHAKLKDLRCECGGMLKSGRIKGQRGRTVKRARTTPITPAA